MGFDVYGKNPKSEAGEYFRNNVWWWHPLWNYCQEVAPEITSRVEHGHSNDRDGLNEQGALMLAEALRGELSAGRTAQYELDYVAELDAMPDVLCDLCNGIGDRPGWVYYESIEGLSVDSSTLKRPVISEQLTHWGIVRKFKDDLARRCNGCNGCEGKGTVRPFATHYPFCVENVENFAAFLENCGGFEIW